MDRSPRVKRRRDRIDRNRESYSGRGVVDRTGLALVLSGFFTSNPPVHFFYIRLDQLHKPITRGLVR
jgi:hypothetical protein